MTWTKEHAENRKATRLFERMGHECLERALGVKMTRKESDDYCRLMSEMENEREIEQAIRLLRDHGYTVRKRK